LSKTEFERNAAFHDRLAPDYDAHLSRNATNTLNRIAFQELVNHYVPKGATILDFGCGTGLDAQQYVQHGYRVLAYDNSPGMVAQLQVRCAAEIAAGTIRTQTMSYPAFLDQLSTGLQFDAVTSDFAVFNSIRDLQPVFEAIRENLAPGGCILISMLNPLHWSKVRMAGWWRDLLRAPRGPRLGNREPYETYLHFVPQTLRAARGFHLVGRANAGSLVRYDAVDAPSRFWGAFTPAEAFWRTPAYKLLGHFVFLVLRRSA
jgi:SAM-dependent methyltransferase